MERVTIKPSTLFRELEGETVLVDIDSGTYFGLDEVGTLIWQQLAAGVAIDDIPAVVVQHFDTSEDVARADLLALLDELVAKGLIVPAGAS